MAVLSLIISADALLERRQGISKSNDLRAVDQHLEADIARVLEHPLYVPGEKALLSRWGSRCREDDTELAFDPFRPDVQRCPRCGHEWSTEQTRRWWVYWYQLWLAERVLVMALRSGPGGDARAESRALETLAAIVENYQRWPNADNVLGPSRPFFSTYLESIWILQLATAASTLDGLGRLPAALKDDLHKRLFAPSAAIIADFDEGRSNRQVWNSAALIALGRLLGDEGMAQRATDGPSGIVTLLADPSVLRDGLWYEGENYHWFALRGLAWGVGLLEAAGEHSLWANLEEAFRAPIRTALPDFTFPARRDSKFGVSLRQRRMAELWELWNAQGENPEALRTLATVYDGSIPEGEDTSWREITEVDRAEPARGVRRGKLGWKAWLWMTPELDVAGDESPPETTHLESTGLAIFRRDEGRTYVSLDYGEPGGGHGHPDRLNLTAVLNGKPWLLDFGTGSYVAPSLAWYRSTLAHNAPLVDGMSQQSARGSCVAFDEREDGYGWICATLPSETAFDGAALQRTVVVTPAYVLDVVQLMSEAGDRNLMIPWHGLGQLTTDTEGLSFADGGATLRVLLSARQPFKVLVQRGPGPPQPSGGEGEDLGYAIAIGQGEAVTLAACLDPSGRVTELECVEDDYIVRFADGTVHLHRATDDGWLIELEQGDPVALGGLRDDAEAVTAPGAMSSGGPMPGITGSAPSIKAQESGKAHPISQPLVLNREDQYRRAEAPYAGPAAFSAEVRLTIEGDILHVAAQVTQPSFNVRPTGATDPEWENENPDIHSDGVQVYLDEAGYFGWLIVPDTESEDRLRVAAVKKTDADPAMISGGSWQQTDRGYRMTFDIQLPDEPKGDFGFDVQVNRLDDGHERRSGQLVWSGANGARLFLAGDRALNQQLPRVKV